MAKKSAIAERLAEMKAMALQLRRDGHTYEQIGTLLGSQFVNQKGGNTFTAVYARKLVYDGIKNIFKDDAESLVRLEMQRLDAMQLEVLNVLRSEHVLVSSGAVVREFLRDENGGYIMDPSTGLPKSAPIHDHAPRLAAVDRLLKIQERRSKLLGLDKPTKTALTTPDGEKVATFMLVAGPLDQQI